MATWLKFSALGRDYEVTLDRLSIAEAREIKRYTGVTLTALMMASSGHVDGDTLAAMVSLAQRRAGEEVDWSAIDELDIVELMGTISVTTDDPQPQAQPATNGETPTKRATKPRATKAAPQAETETATT